ncbi:MAG: CRISPR-associated endonuclease Cas1 [Dehalococcoidia bacterium]
MEAAVEAGTHLFVEQYGAYVGKRSERLRVTVKGEVIVERPLHGLEQVVIASGGVSLSSEAVRACAEEGIQIHFLSRSGTPYARLLAPELIGTVRTRREQLLAFEDQRGAGFCRAIAAGKALNQANLLRYLAKNRRESDPETFELARETALQIQEDARRIGEVSGDTADEVRQGVLTLEAQAAKRYWEAARALLLPELGWERRETRGATDPVNVCLNYGYGILYGEVERAAVLAGLDPYAGFLHVDRSGKPSLALDLIEEFRQAVVDRTVFGLLNRGATPDLEEGRLSEVARHQLAEKILERLDGREPHEGKRHTLRTIVQMQARALAAYVRKERTAYEPFRARW